MSLREAIAEVETAYGAGVVAQGSRGRTFVTKRFQTMLFDFDCCIGGGMPWGKFVMFYGPESGGKSVISYKTIAGAQQYCRYCRSLFVSDTNGEEWCACATECADCGDGFEKTKYDGPVAKPDDPFDWEAIHDIWQCGCQVNPPGTKAKKDRVPKTVRMASRSRQVLFDAENSFDRAWAEFVGIDPDYLFVFVPEYAEQGIDIADMLLRSEEIDVLCVDSVAELTPSKEISAGMEEWQMGLQARLVNKGLRKWNSSINKLGANATMLPLVILINQTRSNIGGYEDVVPGGRAQVYKSAVRVRVNPAQYKFKETGPKGDKVRELLYVDMSGFTKKNKTFPPMRKYSFRLYLGDYEGHPKGSTNEYGVVAARAIEYGVVDRPDKKKGVYFYKSGAYDFKWTSQRKIIEDMVADDALFWSIRDETMAEVVSVSR